MKPPLNLLRVQVLTMWDILSESRHSHTGRSLTSLEVSPALALYSAETVQEIALTMVEVERWLSSIRANY